MKTKQIDLFTPSNITDRFSMAVSDMKLGRKVTVLDRQSNKKKKVAIKSINCDGTITVGLSKCENYHLTEVLFPKRYFKQVISR